ncbi:MAG: hypothetical protein A3G49_05205 [Candidatus Sungbacteria bacterium RIFCSPLOWO2_12_FULL_41_11]|uniref:Uncharacterized protein n=1 Tax=Candidatus Sungbacteria bacterium RIFCSPLOWO2_12_FULL_41_11 TaxID=1802286 RepID=A0A1G2LSU8_9BACT|nr:MAG: hypothetical protein UV01_C0005G0003 [Parcubacteria group bacterium GW2011_GWA2_42_14]OHA14696.1 MAG: hypothetical protein A3G49_05205 [Candidatus Sungbacteria bacterium RIFCSPLOWO2_12_FULL_41_11]
MTTDYHFGKTDGGDVAGFNDPVAANFAYEENLTDSLIREAIQNIIDAKLPGKNPVRAEFDLENFPIRELPNPERLEKIFRKCADYAEKRGVLHAAKHYRAQADILKSGISVSLLRISDYNTCGLTGDTEDGRWFMFMRGVGFNAGEAWAGGAFGLGKGAFFANSLFRTIFVSTVTDEGIKFAGKLRLLSFNQDGELMQGNGTYGLPRQLPIKNKKEIPEIFKKRQEKGTDIWVVNYQGSTDWKEEICRAVLGWFWPAIHWGILTVRVDDKEFDAANLRERMSEFFAVDEKRSHKPYNPLHFFDTYTNSEKKLSETPDMLREISFYGRTSDELPYPNKTALIRNTGMIVDFRGRAFHLAKYAAVFECRNKKGSEILRKLENPAHNEWDWHNWKDEHGHYVEDGKTASQELELFIAEGLSGLLYSPIQQSTTIPGLTDYIGVPKSDGILPQTGVASNPVKEPVEEETGIEIGSEDPDDNIVPTHTIKPIRVKRYVPVRPIIPDDVPTLVPSGPHESVEIPTIPDTEGTVIRPKELENAVVRYVVGGTTASGRMYRFLIHADKIQGNPVVRMKLFGRAEEGEGELLGLADAVGERGTKIIKIDTGYCDFSLDDSGKAYLSIELKDPWVIAINPNLQIQP